MLLYGDVYYGMVRVWYGIIGMCIDWRDMVHIVVFVLKLT